jgi:RNA-directed DNA polymerase
MKLMEITKPFTIPKHLFVTAYKLVKANAGAAGVDEQSLKDFGKDLKKNLYKLWNRMSSGSYMPPAVKAVPIPKKSGGQRILGVPTVGDRICQMVVKQVFEPQVERVFLPDSYGYRPNKSAIEAIKVTRQRCWDYNWILEFDIVGLFDNIRHDLLMKAVRKHTQEKWVILYIERWLKAPMQQRDGSLKARELGTPQGGVISPVLSNLFLHYVFDVWMKQNKPEIKWCRYADDGLAHCRSEQEAQELLKLLRIRFAECGLELHPDKTKIVYCKDGKRREKQVNRQFDFLGYRFRARLAQNTKDKSLFVSFLPAVSPNALKCMRQSIRKSNLRNRTDLSIQDIAKISNPILKGWINYYGQYHGSELESVYMHFNVTLVSWAMRKYKKLKGHKRRAWKFIQNIKAKAPTMFAHWKTGRATGFA